MIRGALLLALLALGGAAPRLEEPRLAEPGWDEIAWPLPRDAWPAGKAYRCRGCDLEVTIRPKLGFCNCTTGVTTDAEVDAVSDVDMINPDFDAPAPGAPLMAAGLRGRGRDYTLPAPQRGPAAGFALSSGCDLLAVASVGKDATDHARILGLVEQPSVAAWIANALGRKRPST